MYKYNEFPSQEDFNHWQAQYGGTFTYLIDLPVGTKFHVNNGFWKGEIIEVKGEKTCLTEIGTFRPIKPTTYAFIDII